MHYDAKGKNHSYSFIFISVETIIWKMKTTKKSPEYIFLTVLFVIFLTLIETLVIDMVLELY